MTTARARVYVCECGPILKNAMDLDALSERIGAEAEVTEVVRHATLCSPDGKEWLAQQMAQHPDERVVIAACSPREHGETFAAAARAAGINPYLVGLASIREQAAWVTPDPDAALDKAHRLLLATLRRVVRQEPLEEKDIDVLTDVLVLGAGVAGLTAAKLLAEAGRKVTLVETSPAVGGRAALLSDIYPGGECASCVLEPMMDEVLHHDNVELLTESALEELLGFLGNFTARIRRRARPVDPEVCYGCHTCHEACPVSVDNPFDGGLSQHKAIHVPYTGALPNVSIVDEAHCLKIAGETCDACVNACPFGAIDFSAAESVVERRVGAVIVATGGDSALPARWRGGSRVIDASTLERLLSSAGPTGGLVQLPGQDPPRSIALILDPGGPPDRATPEDTKLRTLTINKVVDQLSEKLPEAQLHELAFIYGPHSASGGSSSGSPPRRLWLSPSDQIGPVEEIDAGVRLNYTRRGVPEAMDVDLLVVLPPLRGAEGNAPLGEILGVVTSAQGFFEPADPVLAPYRASLDGIYVAGCARSPMDVAETAAAAAATTGGVLSALIPGRRLPLTPISASVDAQRCGRCHSCVVACPFQAVQMDAETGAASVNELLCRGCGCCAAACPCGAMTAQHFTDLQLIAELGGLIDDFGPVTPTNESP
jgi:heterodisulfide reductase subunit A2